MRRAVWALGVCLYGASVCAQTSEDPERRRMIELAGAARDRGDHAGALSLLRQAALRRTTPSLRLFIAQEERATRDLLGALRDARETLGELTADARIEDREYLLGECGSLVAQLEAVTARVVVAMPDDAPPDVEVRLDGELVAADRLGRPVDVMPGAARVEATASGRRPFRADLEARAGDARTVSVRLEVDEGLAPRAADVRPRRAGAGPWVLVAFGAAGLATSGVLFGLRASALSDRDAICGSTSGVCEGGADVVQRAMRREDDAVTLTTWSRVALGVGLAGVVGGGLWWLLARPTAAPPTAMVSVTPVRGGASVAWQWSM